MLMHHDKNHSLLDASWGCLPSPFPKRHAEISQAANERQGWWLSVLPKISWHSPVRAERRGVIAPDQSASATGVKMGGRRAASGQARQGSSQGVGWEEDPRWLFPLTPERDKEQKKVSFLLPSTYQHKCKASSVPKRQSIFTPELLVPPLQHWEPLLPAPSEAECLFPKPSRTPPLSILLPTLSAIISHHDPSRSSFEMKPEGMLWLYPYPGCINSKASVTYPYPRNAAGTAVASGWHGDIPQRKALKG